MDVKKLFTDDDAVSPVIGVILMVAITVILAA
ncbi:MAG: archaellin/type IV pilin N-terminal domain-containing protein, partial [Haloarculaceae archaeon]